MKATLDRAAMVALLKGPFGQKVVTSGAQKIARSTSASAHDGPVEAVVEDPHEGKFSAIGAVTLDHPGGYAMEAKHGYLAKAATAQGYRVSGGAE
ncbi:MULTISPECIES: hypothetical protein [unclassified Microbacterium]|uniref:hypothetical protein n=1 Tax=unclassified Microbacterium TaxID=2609290 RepID=UPI00041B58CD|nr:hypothetical protein [Microbacterium sp. B24]